MPYAFWSLLQPRPSKPPSQRFVGSVTAVVAAVADATCEAACNTTDGFDDSGDDIENGIIETCETSRSLVGLFIRVVTIGSSFLVVLFVARQSAHKDQANTFGVRGSREFRDLRKFLSYAQRVGSDRSGLPAHLRREIISFV